MAFSSSIIVSRNEKLCYNDHSLTFFFSLLSSNCYGGYSGKQQSSIEHDHLNAIHAYTSSFVLVKWILITIGKKKRTKKAITRVRSVSFASKDRLQRACLHSVPYDSFFSFIRSEKEKGNYYHNGFFPYDYISARLVGELFYFYIFHKDKFRSLFLKFYHVH